MFACVMECDQFYSMKYLQVTSLETDNVVAATGPVSIMISATVPAIGKEVDSALPGEAGTDK